MPAAVETPRCQGKPHRHPFEARNNEQEQGSKTGQQIPSRKICCGNRGVKQIDSDNQGEGGPINGADPAGAERTNDVLPYSNRSERK